MTPSALRCLTWKVAMTLGTDNSMARKRRLSCGLTCKGERATLTWLLSAGKILMEKSCKLQRCEGSNFQEEDFPKRKESLKFFYAIFHQTGQTVFENYRKSLIKHCMLWENSEACAFKNNVTRWANFYGTKVVRKCQNKKKPNETFWVIFKRCASVFFQEKKEQLSISSLLC